MRKPIAILLGFTLLCLLPSGLEAAPSSSRTLKLHYTATVAPVPAGEGPVDLFLPLAQSDERQTVLSYEINASIPGEERSESRYGNQFWHGRVEKSDGRPIRVEVTYEIERKRVVNNRFADELRNSYTEEERAKFAIFLGANRRVPISGDPIDAMVREIAPGEESLVVIARAIYDYVVDNMEYKKVGSGWGNGDTHWACSAKYGNCTDFHALFISLARARGIPARFDIGFPISETELKGEVSGYHCWVEFYLPDLGWVPIDASEAKKHPEKRELLFGTHPADRVRFTTGRDISLGAGHTGLPLNYFIYPHAEIGGKQHAGVSLEVRYEEIKPPDRSLIQ